MRAACLGAPHYLNNIAIHNMSGPNNEKNHGTQNVYNCKEIFRLSAVNILVEKGPLITNKSTNCFKTYN